MTSHLIDPGLAEDSPRQMLYDNLCATSCVVWYSTVGPMEVLANYVLSLVGADWERLLFSDEGAAQAKDVSLMFTAAAGPDGMVFAVFPMGSVGLAKLNDATDREWETMLTEMRRGEFEGFPAHCKRATVIRGQVESSPRGGSAVLDIVNQAEVVHVFDAIMGL